VIYTRYTRVYHSRLWYNLLIAILTVGDVNRENILVYSGPESRFLSDNFVLRKTKHSININRPTTDSRTNLLDLVCRFATVNVNRCHFEVSRSKIEVARPKCSIQDTAHAFVLTLAMSYASCKLLYYCYYYEQRRMGVILNIQEGTYVGHRDHAHIVLKSFVGLCRRYPWTRLPDHMCYRDPCQSDGDCCRQFNICDRSAHVCVDCWYGGSCTDESQCCLKYPTCRISNPNRSGTCV